MDYAGVNSGPLSGCDLLVTARSLRFGRARTSVDAASIVVNYPVSSERDFSPLRGQGDDVRFDDHEAVTLERADGLVVEGFEVP